MATSAPAVPASPDRDGRSAEFGLRSAEGSGSNCAAVPCKPRSRSKRKTPGPKPSITLEVVKRVSDRFGRGLTLADSLAAEGNPTINVETWKKALQAHPEFSPHYEAGKGKFLDAATARLAGHPDPKFLCWLLERRHPQLFSKPDAQASVQVNQSVSVVAIPADLIERARGIAERDGADKPKPKGSAPADAGGYQPDE